MEALNVWAMRIPSLPLSLCRARAAGWLLARDWVGVDAEYQAAARIVREAKQ